MTNPHTNARFFIELAEKGKSFVPHTPKRHEDRIALFRKICWECSRRTWFFCNLAKHPKQGEIMIVAEQGIAYGAPAKHRDSKPSALARYRIVAYFLPILEDSWVQYLRMLLG